MNKLITHIKRLALALCFAMPCVSWAGLPTITVNGNDVTISTDGGSSHGNVGTNNGGYDTLTIPAATDLDSGTVLLIKSISFGSRTGAWTYVYQKPPASVTLAGVDSAAAEVTTSGYSDRDKYTYVFNTPCLMKVGTGCTISFKNANGDQANVGLAASLTGSTDQDDYLFTTLKSNTGDNKWSVLTEIVAEKVTGYINETVNGFNTTVTSEKVYVSGVTGYWDTPDGLFGTVDELVVVDGAYQFGHKIVNGNSPNSGSPNRGTAFKKLSGTGTITNGDHANSPTPVVGICDSSEFAGSINIGSGTTRPTILFCTEAEIDAGIGTSLGANLNSLFTSETGRARIYVSAGRTTANNAVVTVPAGKTWTAVNGITNKGELIVDGTVSCNIVNDGTLTVNGTVTGTISGSGTVVVNEGATISSFGSQRDFTGWTIDSSVTAKITLSAEEYGKGSVSVTGATGISSITVLAPDGTTEAGTITPEAGAGTLETGVKTSGLATWCDYEFNGDKSNTGVDKTGLTSDVNTTTYPEIFNDSMLYTYTHPWRNISYPNSWTAVVRCTVPELENAVVVMFGTYGAGAIGLIAGPNPEEEMLLVSTPGSSATTSEAKHFTTLATMSVKDATTAQHVYVFTKDGTTVNVYCDGEKVLDNYTLDSATLGGGLQVGSLHGGVVYNNVHTGLVRFGAGEDQISSLTLAQQQNARIDCMRMFDYIVSPEQIAALSVEFPAVKLYRATVAEDDDTSWTDLTWTPGWDGGNTQSKVILTTAGDATVALPASITVDEVQLDLAEGSTLTLTGPGSLAITQPVTIEDGTLKLTGTVTLTQDTALNGSVVFDAFTADGTGALKLSNGATVGVASGSVVVTPLGTYTCAEGTVVDSAYTGDGVKLMPVASAVCSLTSGTTVRYYSVSTGVFDTFAAEAATDENLVYTILDGTDWSSHAEQLGNLGYYYDQAAGTITRAFARIAAVPYMSLADAVAAATDGATVVLLRASSEEITLNKAITLRETANFSGTLTGNGTLTFYAFRNNPSITFTDWTGTVVLPSFAADGTKLNNYGVAGSTVVLKGITGGWFGETVAQTMTVAPVLQLDGDVTITGFSTAWNYTFAEITGTGTFSLAPADNSPKSATITKVAEGFSGAISNTTTVPLTIGTLARVAATSTAFDTKLLGTTGNVVATALTVGGESVAVPLVTKEDGIYVGAAATVTAGESVTSYSTLAAAVAGATDGATVTLLADVTLAARVEPNLGNGTTLTIDLGGCTITREGTSGNGSAFDVKSGTVTIKNGTIDCTQDDADIVADGVYAITSRSGSTVYLETLTVTVDSECGACAYPFSGSTMTIRSGAYSNTTETPYRYKTAWTGMAVNQQNESTQALYLEGGSFKQVDPKLGDDSGAMTDFCADGKTTELQDGWYVVVDIPPAGFDDGDGGTFTIADQAGITLPTGKTLADVASAATGLTYAQAWALGLLDETTGELEEDLKATIEVTGSKVVVKINGTPQAGYIITLKVYAKASLDAEWPAEPTTTAAFDVGTAGFYKVAVKISNAPMD